MTDTLLAPHPSPYLVSFDGKFRRADASTRQDHKPPKKENHEALDELSGRLQKLQPKLYAHGQYSLLLIFQAMDAAGKDGTIKAVLSGVNPTGCQVNSFKAPTHDELAHDFLWRCVRKLPPRGMIGVFNRSHYEEVLVVRVHPAYLDAQRLPRRPAKLDDLWQERYESIRNIEHHWARNGTVILKFWLNVSKEEQRQRLLARIDEPHGNWKFSAKDIDARDQWDEHMAAYEAALAATSRPWAPWYAIPADSKSYMRRAVAEIVVGTLEKMSLHYPELSEAERAEMLAVRAKLEADAPK